MVDVPLDENVDSSCSSADEQGEDLSSTSDCESPNESPQAEDQEQHQAEDQEQPQVEDQEQEQSQVEDQEQPEVQDLQEQHVVDSDSSIEHIEQIEPLSSDSSEQSQSTLINQQYVQEKNYYAVDSLDTNPKNNEVPKWIAWKWRWKLEASKSKKLSEKVRELEISTPSTIRPTSAPMSQSRSAFSRRRLSDAQLRTNPVRKVGPPSSNNNNNIKNIRTNNNMATKAPPSPKVLSKAKSRNVPVTTPLQSSVDVIHPLVFPPSSMEATSTSSSTHDIKTLTKQVSEISNCLNKMVPTLNFLVNQTKNLQPNLGTKSASTTRAPPSHLATRKNSSNNLKLEQPQIQQRKGNMGLRMNAKVEPQFDQNRGIFLPESRLEPQEMSRGRGLQMTSNEKPQDPFYQKLRSVSQPRRNPQRPTFPCQGVVPESAWIRPKDPRESERSSLQNRGYPMGNITNQVDPPAPPSLYKPPRVHRRSNFGPIPSKGSSTTKALHTLQVSLQHELKEIMSLVGSEIGALKNKKNGEGWKQSLLSVWELSTNVDQLLNKAKHKLPNAEGANSCNEGIDGIGNRSSILKHPVITLSSSSMGHRSSHLRSTSPNSENDIGLGMDEYGLPSQMRMKSCGASQQIAHWQGRQCVAAHHAENLKHQIQKLQARHLVAYKRLQRQDDELLNHNLRRAPIL